MATRCSSALCAILWPCQCCPAFLFHLRFHYQAVGVLSWIFLREFWGVSNIGLSSRVNNFYSLILICTWTAGRKPEAHQEYKPQKTCESQPQPLQPVTLWTWSVGCVRCVVLMIHFPLLGTLIIHILSCECESCEVVIPLYPCENTKAMAMAATSLLPWPILLHTSGHQRMIHYWFMPCQVGKIANEG